MAVKRVQFNNIVQNQLPAYVRSDFPLISDFLKTYYQAQEFQGAPLDLIQNIDQYVKLNEQTGLTESTVLDADITSYDTTISVQALPSGTNGFPESYGLLKIDDEIITYTGKTDTSFTGCVRGFAGISSYKKEADPQQLVFDQTTATTHEGNLYDSNTGVKTRSGAKVENLTVLFLKEFLVKAKHQLLPGFEERTLTSDLNQNLFIKQAKDFYSSKGTDRSFEILFKALYNKNVEIIRPRDFLFTPSNANYRVTNDLVVESYDGDPMDLDQATLYQDSYKGIEKAYGPITNIEKIQVAIGKTYYRMSLDGGYNRDLRVDGATYGAFSVHPETRVINDVAIGQSFINVDSTVGFAHSGNLDTTFLDGSVGVVSYTSKSVNEFYGVTNVTGIISDGTNVGIDTYAYGTAFNGTDVIKIKVTSVLEKLDYPSDTHYYSVNDTARIKSLGIKDDKFKSRDWFYNTSPTYKVHSIELLDSTDWTYKINLFSLHYFRIGDSAAIIGPDGVEKATTVIDITSQTSLTIRGQGTLSLSDTYTFKRNLLKTLSNKFVGAEIYSTNVQNTYKDDNKLLVASSSIPSYNAQALNTGYREIVFSGTFVGDEFKITTTTDHGFRTGDAVYYAPNKINQTYIDNVTLETKTRSVIESELFDEGLYFVKRVAGSTTTVKFSKSRSNIYNGIFVTLDSAITVVDSKIKPYPFKDKRIQSQRLLREFTSPNNDGTVIKTEPGATGLLINGVEVLNYKSADLVRYGEIEEIEVTSSGSDYDIIDPPVLNVSDVVGSGATGYIGLTGTLQDVRVIDPGYDYEETPVLKVRGGNGSGADGVVNMKLMTHAPLFNSEAAAERIGLTTNTIGFGTFHKFRNAEKVIYITNDQQAVGGLSTEAVYHVHNIDDTTVKLHKNEADAVAGINTVDLTSYGFGQHKLQSYNKKSVLESINITNSGVGYENKKLTVNATGINTASNQINIVKHGYTSGEILTYESTGTEIGGLSSTNQYQVIVVDDNNFKLSNAGVGGTNSSNYDNGVYVDITDGGSGIHYFNYQPITISLIGKVGIASVGAETFEAIVQPIFRGQCTSVHLENKGVGYGSSEIVNLDRQPDVTLIPGAEAQLLPIINDGQVDEVIVLNTGKQYLSPPDIVVTGDGTGAVVTPVMENGTVSSVKVIEGGIGYSQQNTSMSILFPGSGVKFNSVIKSWRINLVQKNFNNFTDDDGYMTNGRNVDYELQYTHLYAPRKLREAVYARNSNGDILYGKSDLRRVASVEVASTDHSPIIGWAYDGNPIYGPYGYIEKSGGIISQMKSSYSIKLKDNRPPVDSFPEGIFVEDFTYTRVKDETYLDENNGRYCVTPEFPDGTYAYFATINNITADTSGPFNQYRRPEFPYLIGDNYYSVPNPFNYKSLSNQDHVSLYKTEWLRNIDPYNLMEGDLEYEYLFIPNKLKQTADIKAISAGSVETIGIETGGNSYRIGDAIVFDDTQTQGQGLSIEVSRVLGKPVNYISVASSTVTGVEIYPTGGKGEYELVCATPHGFKDQDLVSITGLSTTSSKIGGVYNAGISTVSFSLVGVGTSSVGIASATATGIVTYFNLQGNLDTLHPNDVLGIGTEQIKVLNVESYFSRIRALRAINSPDEVYPGTTGIAHTVTTVLNVDPRRLTVNAGFNTTYEYSENTQLYFNPSESVAIGTASGVGIGTTIFMSNPGTGLTQLYIPTRAIYIRGHGLKTGDQLTYNTNIGAGLSVMLDTSPTTQITTLEDDTTVYTAKINDDLIGISTVKVGLGTTGSFVGIASTEQSSSTMFFTGVGTGVYHSFTTNYTPITAEIKRNLVTVSTAETHGLQGSNNVWIDVNPSNTGINTVKYNDYNRRVIVNSQDFTAAGVNTSTNAITIANHGFVTGEKIIHTATTPSAGLSDNGIYYIIRVDFNSFKLADSEYNANLAKPPIVGITSASAGTINPITPALTAYKNSTVTFDLSDSSLAYVNQSTSYPAFELNFYKDKSFTEVWNKTSDTELFNVIRTGTVGVTADAKVTLTVNEKIPTTLFYKLDPLYESDLPLVKSEILNDKEVVNGSRVETRESIYNGKQVIAVGATNTFTYSIAETPELSTYSPAPTQLSYQTDSDKAYGSITKFEIKNPGRNYHSLPGITTITSTDGSGAIISVGSTSIGKVLKTKIDNIGYNFPTDTTIRPNVSLGVIADVSPFSSFESIGINSRGRGYTVAPELLVFDGKTRDQITEVDLEYSLGESQVTILQNTYGLNDVNPIILPVQNSNGVGISTVGFNSTTKEVTVTLSVGFSTANTYPFAVGDKVLVEGVSVGVGSTGTGYNSANYNYKLFEVTGLDENYGGIGTVGYSLAGLLDGKVPGEYDGTNSTGRIIPEKYFPMFDIKLKSNHFLEGEEVRSGSKIGHVEDWNSEVGQLTISSGDDFEVGDVIRGLTSNTQGEASNIFGFPATYKLNATSRVENGWETASGFINDNLQRVQDSFYYQNFSYSLKSEVDFDTWDNVVSTTNHTAGFKKFSDYQLITPSIPGDGNEVRVGLTTDTTVMEVVGDLIGEGNLNCVHDFDLVSENALAQSGGTFSDEITFNSTVLQDYYESVGNRVLSIDDMSGIFNSNPRSTPFSIVSQFPLNTRQCMKYITYVRDRRYVAQRQIMVVDLVHDSSFGYINQYGQAGTVYPLGSFDFNIVGTDGRLLWYPNNYKVNDYDVVAVAYNLDNNILGVGATSLGCAEIFTSSTEIAAGATETLVSIGYTYRSLKVLASITGSDHNEFEMEEINLIHDGTTVDIMEYGQLTSNLGDYVSASGFGTYVPSISGTDINLDFKAHTGIACTVNTIVVGLSSEAYVGVATNQLKHVDLSSRTTSIASSTSPGIHTVGQYLTLSGEDDHYDAAYFMIQVSDTTNSTYELSELLMVDDYNADLGTSDAYIVQYGNVATVSGLGTFGAQVNTSASAKYSELMFTPNAGIAVQVKVFMNAFQIEDDDKDIIEFDNGSIETLYNLYEGTEKSILRSFNLTHRNNEIFNKSFTQNDTTIVDTTNNIIRLPNHFFVSGEEVRYIHAGAGTTMAIGCETTSGFSGVGVTDKLPGTVYIYKVNEDSIKIATSAENALKAIPETLGISTVGVGTSARFASINQNAKAMLALDNIIQSPVVSTSVTTGLAKTCYTTDDLLTFTGITSFIGGDQIKIEDEIMRIDGVGIGSTNVIRVRRAWMGTALQNYTPGTQVTKIGGNYNIVENTLTFSEAPYGNLPFGTSTNPPDDRDWTGISTSSSFQGRVFLRSGITDSANETYYKNKVLDDVSSEFTGSRRFFDLKSDGSNVTGIATENAVVLINDVFQGPGASSNYTMSENAGITSIRFTGTATSIGSDVNTSNLPIGGVILSVGSTEGFGYQPLVAAGGTAVVSGVGTISAVTLGYTGSGYRSGIGQVVNVGIQTQALTDTTNITGIGTALIGSDGALTGIAITSTAVIYRPRDISNVGYNSVTGISTITTARNHGLNSGDEINLSGIAFTCEYAPPLGISTVGYSTATGVMTVTTAVGHGLTTVGGTKSNVVFTGLAFTCALDSGAQNHIYPRNRDRFYNTSIEVTGVGNTLTASNAVYDPVVGIVTITTSAVHGMAVGDKVNIADNSLTFTCSKDAHATDHTYPRAGDYASGKWLDVLTVPGTKRFSVKILDYTPSSNTGVHTFVSATSSGITTQTGDITVNVTAADPKFQYAHTFVGTAGTGPIKTGGAYGHHFVGAKAGALISGGSYLHSFSSAVTGGVTITGVGTTTPTDATYDAETGDLVMTISNHGGVVGGTVGIATGGISFKCSLDGYETIHAYPRQHDPIGETTASITEVTGDTVTINVGVSTLVTFTPSAATYDGDTGNMVLTVSSHGLRGSTAHTVVHADYNPTTGIMTCMVPNHPFVNGDRVKFADNSLTFTCAKDSHATNHTYPRASDPKANKWLAITGVTTSVFEVQVLDTIPSTNTGIHTFVSATASGLTKAGESVRLANEGFTFTCEMDQHGSEHSYPRGTDPMYNTAVSIGATTADTLTLNVGRSPVVSYGATTATYYQTNGDLVLGIGTHNVTKGDSIKIDRESLIFTCAKDSNATQHRYPREGDPSYAGTPVVGVTSERTFTVNIGISTVLSYYTGIGTPTVQPIIRAPRPTDEAAPGATVLTVINDKSFEVQTGISTRRHYYSRGGKVEKPMDVVIDDPLSYTNIPLDYQTGSSGIGSEATIDVVVGQGSSMIDFRVNNTGYAYGVGETLTVPYGGGSGIPTTSSFAGNPFELTVDTIFSDEFTAWTIGTLDPLDDISGMFNGGRITFPLTQSGTVVAIRAAKGSVINVQDVLIITVNDILQVPGEGYKFNGGSIIEFTEAPKAGDTCKILFYKGSGDDVDVVFKAVIETVKKGDNLQIYNKDDQGSFWKENTRNVTLVTSTESVDTNPYGGPGNTSIESMLRPVKWCRQTEDKIINDLPVGKDRELYEPVINPTSLIISSVGVGSTQVYVTSIRPFFNPQNETSTANLTFQDKVRFSQPSGIKVAAAATAVVSTAGTISSFTLSEGGIGYGATPSVSIGKTSVGVGTTADAVGTASISNGVVTGIAVSVQGSGYSQTSPPAVLVGPPTTKEEECTVNVFAGDEGIIVGFGTTSVGVGTTAFMMDLCIPSGSVLRNSLYMVDADSSGSITTVSGITTGDYFVVDDSNIGSATTSIVSLDVSGNTVGTGLSFIDNVYQVYSAETVNINVTGIGFTHVRRIFAAVQDPMHFGSTSGITSSPDYGRYSWGKIDLQSRSVVTSYTAYTSSGVAGLTTSPSVERSASLKYKGYNV